MCVVLIYRIIFWFIIFNTSDIADVCCKPVVIEHYNMLKFMMSYIYMLSDSCRSRARCSTGIFTVVIFHIYLWTCCLNKFKLLKIKLACWRGVLCDTVNKNLAKVCL